MTINSVHFDFRCSCKGYELAMPENITIVLYFFCNSLLWDSMAGVKGLYEIKAKKTIFGAAKVLAGLRYGVLLSAIKHKGFWLQR